MSKSKKSKKIGTFNQAWNFYDICLENFRKARAEHNVGEMEFWKKVSERVGSQVMLHPDQFSKEKSGVEKELDKTVQEVKERSQKVIKEWNEMMEKLKKIQENYGKEK